MVIRTKIELNEYLKLVFYLTYRRPGMFIFSVGCFICMVLGLIQYAGIYETGFDSVLLFLFAFYVIFIPIMTYFKSKRNFASNKRIQQPVEYQFTVEKMISKGESFTSESTLNTLHKVEETHKWFLVYQSKQVANLIPKKDMSEAEVNELRNIFKNISGVKLKLKA